MGAQEALDLGIVNYVYPADQLMAKVEEYAQNIVQGATRAIGLIKQAVVQGTEVHLEGGLFMERELQNRLFISEDAKEGIAAWTERRQPEFHGR
jgi:enoyl-CoA hydratase/carnithine racemase